jgi:PIN domain nuclease of toxin-antitoxin system
MRAVADTHSAIWYLWKPENLSHDAIATMDESAKSGEKVGLSSITLCEVVYLVERQRIRSDAFDLFLEAIHGPDGLFEEVPLDCSISSILRTIPPSLISDMPDRIIAATALFCKVPLITKDRAIRESSVPTIW